MQTAEVTSSIRSIKIMHGLLRGESDRTDSCLCHSVCHASGRYSHRYSPSRRQSIKYPFVPTHEIIGPLMRHDQQIQSCQPAAENWTYLTIGQDLFSIQEYVTSQYNASLHHNSNIRPMRDFSPVATMFYTDIQSLRGLGTPADYGSGVEYAPGLVEAFPKSGIQIGLWLNGTTGCRDIVDGKLEANVKHLFHSIVQWKIPKVFLRVGYEFDNPYFGYSEDPSQYQQAFQLLVNECRRQLGWSTCHKSIAFVWHSWAAPRWIDDLNDFYPGDDYVDWVGISIFQQLYPWASKVGNFTAGGSIEYVEEVLEFAKRHDKPVMIAESTPFGGMHWNGRRFGSEQRSEIPSLSNSVPNNIWDLWFAPVLDLIERYDIRMWSYINCDWDAQPMWHDIGFGDTRLSTLDYVMTKWRENVLENPRFVLAPLACDIQPAAESREIPGTVSMLVSLSSNSWPFSAVQVSEWRMDRLGVLSLTMLLCVPSIALLLMWHISQRRIRQTLQTPKPMEHPQRPLLHVADNRIMRYGSMDT